ncbi:endonuclease 8-like 1 isoform X2 [Trichomycterus rosablanca]|uniref:endonuclease 8-like 1 isoform X2 n=1 Tax=Trichomycterus rosablanca TaxID=2290929 RepID=UPI002F354E9D
MPEGPELHLAGLFVNKACAGVIFSGAVEKSEVSKNPEVAFACDAYRISATSRGKEVRLTLTPIKSDTQSRVKLVHNQEPMDVVFRFGMSGYFSFTAVSDLPKHAHLRFYTKEKTKRVLSFVDTRRFGSWQPNGNWQQDRGPCVMLEYESFRLNVLSNLSDKAFDKPICEALLNQKYFNGIGNYLRAEILYRLNTPPFVKARSVLDGLELIKDETKDVKEEITLEAKRFSEGGKIESPDLLSLCHTVPLEVVNLGGKGYDPAKADYSVFQSWLQCYFVDGMKSARDRNGRTIWFKGDPGPMVPKGSKSLKRKRTIKKDEHDYTVKKEKPVKKEPRARKQEQDVSEKKCDSRKRTSTKIDTDAAVKKKRTNAHGKSDSAGMQKTNVKSARASVRGRKAKAKNAQRKRRN